MTVPEKLGLLVFVGGVFCVYGIETVLVFTYITAKFFKKPIAAIFWCKAAWVVHVAAIIGVICFLYGYFIEPYWIEVNYVTVETEKLKNTNLRVVQISDLHCDKKPRNESKIVEIINSLKPDIIVYTGDSLNTSETLERFKDTLAKLNASIGKFAVRGNFDVYFWHMLDLFGGTGFEVLDEKNIRLEKNNECFYVSGLNCKYPGKMKDVLKGIPADNLNIFLFHYPDLIEEIGNKNIDLYLCGHTHGGQVALPFYGAVITLSKYGKKYESGLYKIGDKLAYVNRGIGMEASIAPRVRFFARPEIAVFDIKPKAGT